MKKRLLSLLLVLCMVFTMMPVGAFATETGMPTGTSSTQDATLWEHHTEHNEDCGYAPETAEVQCNHQHNEDCGFIQAKELVPSTEEIFCDKDCTDPDGDGNINHADGCAYTPATVETPAVEGIPCNHEHEDTCGYAPATKGSACSHICEDCVATEAMLRLRSPRSLAVTDAANLADALGGDSYAAVSGNTVTLIDNVDVSDTIEISSGTIVLNLNGKNMVGIFGVTPIMINGDADVTIQGNGKITGGEAMMEDGGNGVNISGGSLTVKGGTFAGGDSFNGSGANGINVSGTANLTIIGGTFVGGFNHVGDQAKAIVTTNSGGISAHIVESSMAVDKQTQPVEISNANLANATYIEIIPDISAPADYGDFSVAVVDGGTTPSFADGILTFGTEGEYTVSMKSGVTSTSNRIAVTAGNVALNLNGVTISAPQGAPNSEGTTALTVKNGTVLNIIANSSFTGGVPGNYTPPFLSSNKGGAGISGNIVVTGTATLTATGGNNESVAGVGISGNVNVSGGVSLIAAAGSGEFGMAIKDGFTGGKITVGDGYIVKEGDDAASAASAEPFPNDQLEGNSFHSLYIIVTPAPLRTFDIANGNITVTDSGTNGKIKVAYKDATHTDKTEDNIDPGDMLTITQANAGGPTNYTVTINTSLASPINITLDGVNIAAPDGPFKLQNASVVNLTLKENTISTLKAGSSNAGLEVSKDASVIIEGKGMLNARNNSYGSGIGGGEHGTVTIKGGTVNATGGSTGAGIGGAVTESGGTVVITGGNVNAVGGSDGAENIGKGTNGSSSGTLKNTTDTDIFLATFTEPTDNKGKSFTITKAGGTAYSYDLSSSQAIDGKWYVYLPSGAAEATYGGETYTATVRNDHSAVFEKKLPTAAEYAVNATNEKDTGDYWVDTSSSPQKLHIYTDKGAAYWSSNGNTYLDYYILLENSVEVGEFLWTPVGDEGHRFMGIFDGQGNTLRNLTIAITATSDDIYAGLIGGFQGTIKNLGLVDSNISATGNGTVYVGGIAGAALSYSSIVNCYNTGAVRGSSGSGEAAVGGIIGINYQAGIQGCYTSTAITAEGTTPLAGGIVGEHKGGNYGDIYYSSEKAVIGTNSSKGTAMSEANMKAKSGDNALLTKLNAWVTGTNSTEYYKWKADSTETPINNGYPVFEKPVAVTEAKWGTDTSHSVGSGTLTDAVAYANSLSSGTAYIQLQSDVNTTTKLEFVNDKITVLDLNGFDIDRGLTSETFEGMVLIVRGNLTLKDTSTTTVADQGKITGGNNNGAGGGVYVSGTFSMEGGNITGNMASKIGGGVIVYNTGSFTVGGTAVVSGNTSGTAPDTITSNVCLEGSMSPPMVKTLTISKTTPLAKGASIGVTSSWAPGIAPVEISGENDEDYSKYFTSDNQSYEIFNGTNNVVSLKKAPATTYTITKGTATNGSYTVKVGASEVTSASENATVTITPTAGVGYELDKITVTKTADITTTVTVTNGSFTMPAYAVTVSVNFKAVGDPPSLKGSITGTITDSSDTAVNNAKVKIMRGATQLATTTTDASGAYNFSALDYGVYSLVIESGTIKVTKIIEIKAESTTQNMKLPRGNSNTEVKTEANTPPTAAEGLNELFDTSNIGSNTDDTKGITTADITEITNGGSVTVTLTSEKKTESEVQADANAIKAVATGEGLMLLDFTVRKVVTPNGGTAGSPIVMTELPSVIEVVVEIPESLRGAASINAYRVHNNTATKFANTADGNGEYAERKGNYMHIYTKNFSTYALTYTAYQVTISNGGTGAIGSGGYVAGDTVTIHAGSKNGYSFNGWTTSDGVSFANANSVSTTFTMPSKAVTVTANWTQNGGSSGSGSGGSSYGSYGIKITKEGNGTISPDGGSDNTLFVREWKDQPFTFTPEKGYVVSEVLIDGNNIGAVSKYTFENVKKDHTLKVIFKANDGHQNPQTGLYFDDVKENDWFYDDVINAVEKGWFTGTSDTGFSPNLSTTRGMIATVLHRMENQPKATIASAFDDVTAESWYYNGVTWAQEHDIVKGYENGKYGPLDEITREQIASILYRYGEFKGYDVSMTSSLDNFKDGDKVSAYATATMKWAVGANLISGKQDKILDPRGNATRAEVAAILTRFDEMFSKK
ncbi:S-layer homology domain-containing protein [Anaerotignum sp.]|uniref:S-layer homology domain-containing protein n=1 Tax=Anaerotignum sp. TaxID=2039241 RepID=UPI0028A9FDB4|nr:S-layer homology domain-containing protein [Anaerotignum sp.]